MTPGQRHVRERRDAPEHKGSRQYDPRLSRGVASALGAHTVLPFVDYDWDAEFARAIGLALQAGARRVWALTSQPCRSGERIVRLAKAMAPGAGRASVTIHANRPSAIVSPLGGSQSSATGHRGL